ncbi:hypothetical protein [Enterobacter phage vB_EclM_AS6]|uniref:Uncharacterized protein n=1 Tax=Klebsiella phage vB_KaeM_KaAlpha TaxID=2591367 RepID=A0A5B9NGH9_9CAUD|nr:hypothetical protein KAALPHA_111 [Klebsiella phage vB_KaeM_KaAlpha]
MRTVFVLLYLFVQYHNPLFTYNLVNGIMDLVQRSL